MGAAGRKAEKEDSVDNYPDNSLCKPRVLLNPARLFQQPPRRRRRRRR